MVGRGLRYDREGMVKISDIPPSFKAFKIHHHVVLNPVCHRTAKDKGMAIDCRGIDNKSEVRYNITGSYSFLGISLYVCKNDFQNLHVQESYEVCQSRPHKIPDKKYLVEGEFSDYTCVYL